MSLPRDVAITDLLNRGGVHPGGWHAVAPLIDRELRSIAVQVLSGFRHGGRRTTLEPDELINEFFMRLLQLDAKHWSNRAHFFAYAATAMRSVLLDRNRIRSAVKRIPAQATVPLAELTEDRQPGLSRDVLATVSVREAVRELERLSPRQAEIAGLRLFSDLAMSEIALVLGISERTCLRDWQAARAFLMSELIGSRTHGTDG
ncbi:MAG: sigma-70 family RNA polymerase sigma factor [Bryobacteraceae bacterium]|nr:sigma-70 family RNA polymerase sigma factor [Bryobacteraceae bacterium]